MKIDSNASKQNPKIQSSKKKEKENINLGNKFRSGCPFFMDGRKKEKNIIWTKIKSSYSEKKTIYLRKGEKKVDRQKFIHFSIFQENVFPF